MPIGCYSLVPHIAAELCRRPPKRILDLGIGMGIYGAVVRQWLDLGVRPWRTVLHGVEAFAAYENPCWALYDHVHIASIESYLAQSTDTWDVILLLDVLEHFTHDEGVAVIAEARARLGTDGRLFIGTPAIFCEQGAAHGNEFERHKSLWSPDWFRGQGFSILSDDKPDAFGNQMILARAMQGDAT